MIELPRDEIKAQRIILRKWIDSDLEALYEFGKVEGVGEAAGWHHFFSRDDARDFLDMFKSLNTVFCIYHIGDEKAIGTLDFIVDKDYPDGKTMCIGYSLSKDYWGQGIMKEAIEAAIPFFKSENMSRLSANVYSTNMNSIKLLKKLDFRFMYEFEDKDVNGRPIVAGKYVREI